MKKGLFAIAVVCLCSFMFGCTTGGNYSDPRMHGTKVDLNRKNFRMIKAGAVGYDSGFWLLGFIPLSGRSEISAMNDLYSKVDVNGRATTLVNVIKEASANYYILFSIPSIKISADVIEFLEEPESSNAKAVE